MFLNRVYRCINPMNESFKIFLVILVFLLASSHIQADDYYIDRNNGSNVTGNGTKASPWETISFGLSKITGSGHTAHVASGVYDLTFSNEGWNEIFPIMLKDGVSLVGEGFETTIIDADSTNYALLFKNSEDNSTTIDGFSIKGGSPAGIKCEDSNGIINSCKIFGNTQIGLNVYQTSKDFTLEIKNNIIEENGESKNWGMAYGISCIGGNMIIIDNTIQNNISHWAFSEGYGIDCSGCGLVKIRNNQVKNNRGSGSFSKGYGIKVSADSVIVVENEVNANYNSHDGAGITCLGYNSRYARVDSNLVRENLTGINISINNVNGICRSTMEYNTIYNNRASGIAVSSGKTTITRNMIYSNDTNGITLSSLDSTYVYNNTINNNNIGVNISKQGPIIYNNIISDNTEYAIYESGEESDPMSCAYNLFSGNANLYYNEGYSAFPNIMMLETIVPECSNNLEGDPLFVDPDNDDFNLLGISPAINAGDIDSPIDPDGTRVDIGAFFFDLSDRPGISITATAYDIGDVKVDTSTNWILTISNVGTASLSVTSISSDNKIFTVDKTSFTVPPDGSQNVLVTFTPISLGSVSAVLTITSNDPDEGTLSISVSGNGTGNGILGDVNNSNSVNITDALIVATYDLDPSITIPNNGDIRQGDVNKDDLIKITDALIIATYDIEPTNSNLPSGIGQPAVSGKLVAAALDAATYTKGTVAARLDVTETEQVSEKKVTVAVNIDMSGIVEKLGAYSAVLSWDPEALSFEGYKGGVTGGFDNPLVMTEDGRLRFNQFDTEGAGGNVNIVNVSFMIKGEITEKPLSIEFSSLNAASTFKDLLPNLQVMDNQYITSISSSLPLQTFSLSQNYPNPFNAGTTITYELPNISEVNLSVYNINGQRIRTLVGEERDAGSYSVAWDGKNDDGQDVASGFYLYRLKTDGFVKIRTMVYIR